MSDRIGKVRDFLAGGGSICPFAKRYVERTAFAEVSAEYGIGQIRYPIIDLAKSSELMAAVYVFDSDLLSHEEERQRSIRLFKGIFRVLALEMEPAASESELLEYESELDAMLRQDSNKNPLLGYEGKALFSIAMNPVYDRNHPRWSPCSTIVVTRHDDVAAASSAAPEIHKSIVRRIGELYDADQLYLMPGSRTIGAKITSSTR